MEVPQLITIQQRSYLLFSVPDSCHSSQYVERASHPPLHGMLCMAADTPVGPFDVTSLQYVVADKIGSLYSGKLIEGADGQWMCIAFRQFAPDGSFIGELNDPIPIHLDEAGNLCIN